MELENKNPMSKSTEKYFAAKDAKDTAQILLNKADSFFNNLNANSYIEKLKMAWKFYHGIYGDTSHQIDFTGEQEELVTLPVNHYRNLAQHIYVMITSNRPTMDARAINTDYKSLAQTYLANGVLDYYMRERHLEDFIKKAAELAISLGGGFIKLDWNATAGEVYDYDEESGQFNYEGDVEFTNLTPLDVIFDGSKENWNNDWIMVRTFKNRYDLIAKYPELESKIRSIPSKENGNLHNLSNWSNEETDDVPVYEFYHKRTEAMPDGRYMLFLDRDVVLMDTKLPYRVIPIFRIAPSDILGTPYGYTPMFDILPIQEAINSTYSAIMTNQNAFAVQNLFVPRGADININSLDGAMNIIEGNHKPEPLNLTETPAEVFKFLEILIQSAETISGVNSVARGSPEASLKSGTALALVQSMALQFTSGLQHSYVKLVEDVGTALIQILKDFAHTPRVIAVVGKNKKALLKEFTGDQISAINRVVVDIGNPLSKTTAGRVQMADQLLQMNLLKNPQQYFQIINTGKLDTAIEGEMSELLLIKAENEKMLEGKHSIVSPLDSHRIHILEHKSVLADPDLRDDPELVQNVLDHIQMHVDALRNTDPDLLMLMGEQPLTPPGAAPPSQGPQGPMPGGSSPMPDMMSPNQGQIQPETPIQQAGGPPIETPPLPQVNPSLLSNPELQSQSMGNIEGMTQ